ncbi:hypothetical protein EON65_04705 [archaeon]|nr:MAG: hypothetical protein EON65_04705 [archaeon]
MLICLYISNISVPFLQARLFDDTAGNTLKAEFRRTKAVIVPIFDGVRALSPTMRAWLETNFPNAFNEMEGESGAGKVRVDVMVSSFSLLLSSYS